jgi:hypothetical protein
VVDQLGIFTLQYSTNKYLRSQRKLYHSVLGDITHQIDEELNIFFRNSSTSTETKVDLGALNVFSLSSKDVKLLISNTGQLQFGVSLTTKAPTTTLDASTLLLGKSARIHWNSTNVGFGPSPAIPIALATPIAETNKAAFTALASFLTALGAAYAPIAGAAATASAAMTAAAASTTQFASTQVKATL